MALKGFFILSNSVVVATLNNRTGGERNEQKIFGKVRVI
nr:MAG TPA: hypothetical protein [Caudoviricetes sp.]